MVRGQQSVVGGQRSRKLGSEKLKDCCAVKNHAGITNSGPAACRNRGRLTGDVLSRRCIHDLGPVKIVKRILVVRPGEKAHICGMTTTTRPGGLCGWSIWCASVAIFLAFCASAFAGANSGVSPQKKVQSAQKFMRKVCFAHSSSSAIPQPCDRIFGPLPTTTTPLEIIRR